jgi:hypothetical protein
MGDDPCVSASVKQVKIESVDDRSVTFSTRSASRTGDPHECLRRKFTVPRAEVHTTPGKGVPQPVELKKGKTGRLYLTRAGWGTKSADGFQIHGMEDAQFKYPNCAAATQRLLTNLSVVPTSILVRGHLENETEFFDIELIGPDAAESQAIHWNSADYLDVRLSSRGARRLRLTSRSTTAKLWPISIKIKGSPAIDLAVSGEVDLLNIEMAEGEQELKYTKPGSPIKVTLTQLGVAAFHLTPQAVAELTGAAAHVVAPCHGCAQQTPERAQQVLERVGKRSGVTRRRPVRHGSV